MVKRVGSSIRIMVAVLLSVFVTNFAPVVTAYAATDPALTMPETAVQSTEPEETQPEEVPAPLAAEQQEVTAPLLAPVLDQTPLLNLPAQTPKTVTPKAPRFDDVCGKRHDTYTIPYQHGVTYQVDGQTANPGREHGKGTITVTAQAASVDYVLDGTASWTFSFTDKECVSVYIPEQPCVDNGASNGKIKVKVTNNHDFGAVFKVSVDGTDIRTDYLQAGESRWFTFWGYEDGTYHIKVKQITQHGSKTVFEDCFTLDECPCEQPPIDDCEPGQGGGTVDTPDEDEGYVQGDEDESDEGEVEAVEVDELPDTGADGTLTTALALITGLATYAFIARKTSVRE